MRFASRFANYRHGVRSPRFEVIGHDHTGQAITRTTVSELSAQFTEGRYILTEDEIQQAISGLVHMGLPLDRDTETLMSPRSRISGFDSVLAQEENGWTDDERELVEQALLKSEHRGSDHMLLEVAAAELPWPSYDSDDLETIQLIATRAGLVDKVKAYEAQNGNRPEVLELFEEVETDTPVTVDAS